MVGREEKVRVCEMGVIWRSFFLETLNLYIVFYSCLYSFVLFRKRVSPQ